MSQFDFKEYLNEFISKKQNQILLGTGLLLTSKSFLQTIFLPQQLTKLNFTSKFSITLFIFYLLILLVLDLIYRIIMEKLHLNIQKFSYNYITCKLLNIKECNLDKIIESSTYVSIVSFVNNLTNIIVHLMSLIPFLVSILFIFVFILRNISFSKSLTFLILILIQLIITLYFSKEITKFGYLFNNERHNLTDLSNDINIISLIILHYYIWTDTIVPVHVYKF